MRTIIGPLRMLLNMPSRRKKDRPKQLPLKVKYPSSADWEIAYVDRKIYPFLVGLPLYPMPIAVTQLTSNDNNGSATESLWVRGAGFWENKDAHLQYLCDLLGAVAVMPTATIHTDPFCLMLAKIAHSFTVAEYGLHNFSPFLREMILNRDLSKRAFVIGGGKGNEKRSDLLHELVIEPSHPVDPNLILVRVRILGILGTPTYYVAAGIQKPINI